MKAREYCCCAIPIVNAGIYFTLIEQFVAGILVGVLSMATPSIVGAVTPSFAPWVFGIICFVAGALQVLGLIGVSQEKSILFRRYLSLHSLVTLAAFSVALAWIIMSATRHSTAESNCMSKFFPNPDDTQKTEGEALCKIFPFVDVGVMGGLWAFLAAVHIYLYVVMSSYSKQQQRDHAQYDTVNASTTFNNDTIPMNRKEAWESQPLTDPFISERNDGPAEYSHLRKESAASASDLLAEPVQKYNDNYSLYSQGSYPPPTQQRRQPSLPQNAYTHEPTPTPKIGESYYSGDTAVGTVDRPALSQAHPAEGSFGRKTPRLMKSQDDYR